eukprot:CAMPEP_0204628676 /NCGR_PEP_ID=MMETSP0717-20131115/16407_1 /ASSEMBLY_ACC=CAM_ASM_000666 /TAXON_ID=230516 /ORGANISM="Chaetoceros curvisetus" /LENGTH=232 /DNA_ID=CAMNT_0051645381 /DNA_START=76 /DNA_END=774 /DNA_ORIENTATION=-
MVVMHATEGEASSEEPSAAEEEISTTEEETSEEEAPASADDEVDAIKKEIAELETTLKNKNREINNVEKLGEQYTEAGYAREVAKMESYRRSRSANAADGKLVATANVLQNFLPIVDELQGLSEKYEGDEFAKKYSALSSEFMGVMSKMGVQEFTVAEGDKAEPSRVTAVVEEHSDSVPKGCVISPIEGKSGYELEGNVMRMAEAVVSLGPEASEEEAEESEEESNENESEE